MKIDVKHPTVQEVFKDSFYEVPAFQREYVWKEIQVQSLLDDVFTAIFDENDAPSSDEYFIGSIVAYLDEQKVYQLIDGQQRLTTLFIILCAIRDRRIFLKDVESVNYLERMIKDEYQKTDGTTGIKLRLKPLYGDAGNILQDMASRDKTNFDKTKLDKTLSQSAKNMRTAYNVAFDFLIDKFKDVNHLRVFQAKLSQQVRLVRIETPGISDALHIFETINDRGVGLNALDLLKNLLFMQVEQAEFNTLTSIWEEIIKIVDGKPLRFLRYFILANFSEARNEKGRSLLTERNLYVWLSDKNNEKYLNIKKNPIGFADRLYKSSLAYKGFISKPNIALSNIYAISKTARQHLIVLLACQKLNDDMLSVVTYHLERLSVVYSIADLSTKVFDRKFADMAPGLKDFIDENISNPEFKLLLNNKVESWVDNEIKQFASKVSGALDVMSLNRRTPCRFILARLSQYVEDKAKTSLKNLAIDYFVDNFEVEHILPNNPSSELVATFDKPSEYEYYKSLLGNLILLEKPLNASLGRDYFSAKKLSYGKSSLFLTKSLSNSQAVGGSTYTKAAKYLNQYSEWNSSAIESRQQEMKRLVMEMLGLSMLEDTTSASL